MVQLSSAEFEAQFEEKPTVYFRPYMDIKLVKGCLKGCLILLGLVTEFDGLYIILGKTSYTLTCIRLA